MIGNAKEPAPAATDTSSNIKADLIKAKEEGSSAIAEKEKLKKELDQFKKVKANLERRINKLQNAESVKETITVTDETEIKRLKGELEKSEKQIRSLQADLESAEKPEEIIKDEKELFKARLEPVIDGVKRLMSFINEHNDSADIEFYKDKLKAIRVLLGGEE